MLIGHSKQWEFLKKNFEQNQLSHAYLFSGADGIGKKFLAKEFVKYISCSSSKISRDEISEDKPCQKCFSCSAIERGAFPDLMLVEPSEGGEIQIFQIKQVRNFLSYKSYYGSYRAIIVDDAGSMNQEAQSCFLKTLEEPKGKTLIFLISSKPDMFLPTITSRCQIVKFFKPKNLPENQEKTKKEKEILEELIPVISSSLAEKFKYTKSLDFEKCSAREILEVLQKHFRKQLLNNFSDKKAQKILELSEEISQKLLFTNANPKLALEILLMEI